MQDVPFGDFHSLNKLMNLEHISTEFDPVHSSPAAILSMIQNDLWITVSHLALCFVRLISAFEKLLFFFSKHTKGIDEFTLADWTILLTFCWIFLLVVTWACSMVSRLSYDVNFDSDGRPKFFLRFSYALPVVLFRIVNWPISFFYYGLDWTAWTDVDMWKR